MKSLFAGRGFGAFLFDMDGTLINSIAAANRVWTRWAEMHGIDPEPLLRTMHGSRSVDTISRLNLPGMNAELEADAITRAEIADVDGVVAIAGAVPFLRSLPSDRWAVVTSAPRALAERRLDAAGIPVPPLLVTAEDVTRGKPAPDCYLLAAGSLGIAPRECLVWEDTRTGIGAAEAAGAQVVVVSATHAEAIDTRHPAIGSYETISVMVDASRALVLNVQDYEARARSPLRLQ